MGHTYFFRPERGAAATSRVCADCLQQQRLAGSCNRLGHACSGRSPSQCLRKPEKPAGGERGCNGGPAPCASLDNDALLLWCPGLFLQIFPGVSSLLLSLQGCLFTANSCPLPRSTLQTPFSSPRPPSTTGDSQLRLGCAELRRSPCSQFVLCTPSHRPSAAFSFDPPKVPFYPS